MHHSTARRWQELRKPFRAQARKTPLPHHPEASTPASGRPETPPPCRRQGSIFPPPGSHAPRCAPASRAARCEEASAPPFRGLFALLPERIPVRRKAVRPCRFFPPCASREGRAPAPAPGAFHRACRAGSGTASPRPSHARLLPHFLQYSMNGFRTKETTSEFARKTDDAARTARYVVYLR